MGGKHTDDYTITFLDCQELQLLYRTLLKVSSVLDSGLEVVEGCKGHCCKLHSLNATALYELSLREIDVFSAQMRSHRRNVRRLIEQCKGTRSLVCQQGLNFVTG